jgi:transglutaminase-like putative cysteine protease
MTSRRSFLCSATAVAATAAATPWSSFAQQQPQERRFAPQPDGWRSFDVTTRVDLVHGEGARRVWLPVPSVDSAWQQSLDSRFSSNGRARMASDTRYGARMLHVEFDAGVREPYVELVSRVRTRDRAIDWARPQMSMAREERPSLKFWTESTALIPTDGIVRSTAEDAVRGARTDVEKVRALYEWIVANTYREPQVRGCGEGDIKSMLETGNLGGKCADLNALFVGLCRSVGVPARDVYGIRLAPSAFGYRELGASSANLKSAQHCRAEVHLQAHGWVAMDPADVAKVMRQETPQWIKTTRDPLVAPVHQGLFGGWEGNWLAWNTAHDVALPGSSGPKLGFFMYPVGEDKAGRLDSYAPDDFKYQISAKELAA